MADLLGRSLAIAIICLAYPILWGKQARDIVESPPKISVKLPAIDWAKLGEPSAAQKKANAEAPMRALKASLKIKGKTPAEIAREIDQKNLSKKELLKLWEAVYERSGKASPPPKAAKRRYTTIIIAKQLAIVN